MAQSENVALLSVLVHDEELVPSLTALCAGYELGEWRANQLADYLMNWMLEFCLTYSELEGLNPVNATELIKQSASRIYQSKKFERRGEFGELMLHAILRQVYATIPAVSKIYYKDSANDTVKGFDAVHVVAGDDSLELWLGEAKFYDDIYGAITAVAEELVHHTRRDYLRAEFIAIKNKIDDEWPHAERLKRLLHEHTSLDEIFDSICIPVLLTYDSEVLARHQRYSDEYRKEVAEEFSHFHGLLAGKELPQNVKIHLFLVPLNTKKVLLRALDEKLRVWQSL